MVWLHIEPLGEFKTNGCKGTGKTFTQKDTALKIIIHHPQ